MKNKKILLMIIPLMLAVSLLAIPVSADEFPTPNNTVGMSPVNVQGVGSVDLTGYTQITDLKLYEGDGTEIRQEFSGADNYFMCDGSYYVLKNLGFYESDGQYGWAFNIGESDQRYFSQMFPNRVEHNYAIYLSDYPGSLDSEDLDIFGDANVSLVVAPSVGPGDPNSVTSVWASILAWITTALASVQAVFFVNGSLTFIGTLALIGVSIAIAWLIIAVVERFLCLRG